MVYFINVFRKTIKSLDNNHDFDFLELRLCPVRFMRVYVPFIMYL